MVNKDTSERPINPKAAATWDLREKRKTTEQANERSKRQAIKEIAKASRVGGKESRTGLVESGLVNPKKLSRGLISGIIDSGNRRRRNNSW
jgi:hypothetical protein